MFSCTWTNLCLIKLLCRKQYLPKKKIAVNNNEFSAQNPKFNNKVCSFILFIQEILLLLARWKGFQFLMPKILQENTTY